MAHMIMADDTMAYRASGGVTWHGLGSPIGDEISDQDFFLASGLDWKVVQMPLLIQGKHENRPANGYRALVRSTDGKCLGIATEDYHVVQNSQVWEFFRNFCEAGEMKLETAGSLCGGRKVWALAKMNGGFTLLGTTDHTDMYALFSTGHEPGFATQAELTAIRVVCHNTLSASRGHKGEGGDGAIYGRFRLSHLARWTPEQAANAKKVVEGGRQALTELSEKAERLYKVGTDTTLNRAYLVELFQPEVVAEILKANVEGRSFSVQEHIERTEVQAMAGRRVLDSILLGSDLALQADAGKRVLEALTNAVERQQIKYTPTVERVYGCINSQPGSDQVGGTLWNTQNAVSYYVDNVRGRQGSAALDSALFGEGRDLKTRALDLAVEYAERMAN